VVMGNVPYKLNLLNGSGQPVYDFEVIALDGRLKWPVFPPTPNKPFEEYLRVNDLLRHELTSTNPEYSELTITFRDAKGQRWRRTPNGMLTMVD
ncbi:MAG: hypothetical protein ACRD2A_26005, partial [Vicinamibacterales bacterium]